MNGTAKHLSAARVASKARNHRNEQGTAASTATVVATTATATASNVNETRDVVEDLPAALQGM